jgi:hypothetical protein
MIRKIKDKEINITIRELKNFNKRFPNEFYQIYSSNESFKQKKIYKIIIKNDKKIKYNIIIINDINNLYDETIIDLLENYEDKDIIFSDDESIEHDNFYNVFNGLDILYFNWNKNCFYYYDRKSGPHFTDTYKKYILVRYLKNKKNPFISTPQISPTLKMLEISGSYFPT